MNEELLVLADGASNGRLEDAVAPEAKRLHALCDPADDLLMHGVICDYPACLHLAQHDSR